MWSHDRSCPSTRPPLQKGPLGILVPHEHPAIHSMEKVQLLKTGGASPHNKWNFDTFLFNFFLFELL